MPSSSFATPGKASDGATEGAHKSSAAVQWEKLGKSQLARALLPDPPHFPDELDYLWTWYRQHEFGLAVTGHGAGGRDLGRRRRRGRG